MRRRRRHRRILRLLTWFGHTSPLDLALTLERVLVYKGLGATRVIECWGGDVPKGGVTDFYKATQAKDDETVIFSWVEYPDKETRDAANKKMSEASDISSELPFDSERMFFGGFKQVVNE